VLKKLAAYHHNKCQINLPEDDIMPGHTSCRTCFNARIHVRKDHNPKLFAALNDDVQSQIDFPITVRCLGFVG
jgi:hypothetical protein